MLASSVSLPAMGVLIWMLLISAGVLFADEASTQPATTASTATATAPATSAAEQPPSAFTPAPGPLSTRWGKSLDPQRIWPEYPRPQLTRPRWLNLNGIWQYSVRPASGAKPAHYDGNILVPFPIESALSGVARRIAPDERLWYRRTFDLPGDWRGRQILLHFGAVDWDTRVFINGEEVGQHRGGYDPFTCDITAALKPTAGQEIVVAVQDPTDAGTQPRGKQVRKPESIWYTPTTGIWQTVWLEPVHTSYITRLATVPRVEDGSANATVTAEVAGDTAGLRVEMTLLDKDQLVAQGEARPGAPVVLRVAEPRLWSPASPFLYDLHVTLMRGHETLDEVRSYIGLRSIRFGPDADGITRILLNGEPIFQIGLLDQGFWPDGLYTAPSDEAMRHDLHITRRLGYNMIRKHVKVEPARWYYACDQLGLLVWQDMPSGDAGIGPNDPDLQRSAESAEQYRVELGRIVAALQPFPCIIMWVPFNEGWGQFDTAGTVRLMRGLDPYRLINSASGWTDRGVGDVHDLHAYPGPAMPPLEGRRAAVLGEFGGLGLPMAGHTWQQEANWGYRNLTSTEQLTREYLRLVELLRPLRAAGLCAAVYTQTTDVEIEVNGVMTYDREIIKLDESAVAAAHARLLTGAPRLIEIVPTSRREAQLWRYNTEAPPADWAQPAFDDAPWSSGPGGFGTESTPNTVVRTTWNTPELWARRHFEFAGPSPQDLCLHLHHDEDVEVYLNGQLILRREGFTTDYTHVPVTLPEGTLRQGDNLLAVHIRQTAGGQYMDVGMSALEDRAPGTTPTP